ITLSGSSPVTIEACSTYTDEGATASDCVDGDLTASIVVAGDGFDTSVPGTYTVTYNVQDAAGNNAAQVTRTVIVEDTTAPNAVCQNITIQLDASGNASIVAADINNGSSDSCGSVTLSASQTTFDCSDIGPNNITLTVTDEEGNTNTCTAIVTVEDSVVPTITCPSNITSATTSDDNSGNCTTTVNLGTPTASDNCSTSSDITFNARVNGTLINPNTYLFPIGTTTVVWTAIDESGNVSASCNQLVTVTDDENPIITCAADMSANTADDGSGDCSVNITVPTPTYSDNCNATLTWTMTGTETGSGTGAVGNHTFSIGTTTITYTVTDGANLTNSCSQIITVIDDENPSISFPGNQNVTFDNNCQFTLQDYTGLASTLDNCDSNVSLTQSPAAGSILSGTTTVTITATDDSNNVNTSTFNVIPTDNVNPIASCQDISVNLSANGTVNISAANIDNGSSDNCSIANMTVSPSSFNCTDVGPNTVTFTVYDDAGNSDSCTAIVTVVDNTAPNVICNDFVVVLDAITREATIQASDVDNGSNDACGIASLTVSPNTFPEDPNGNIYTTTATLTATDINGNISTCTATITVEPPKNQFTYLVGEIVSPIPDNPQPPSALIEVTACPGDISDPRDIELTLQPIGTYNLQASDVLSWEYSNDNGETWITIPNTAGLLTYTLLNVVTDTFVRLKITDADDPSIIKTSAEAYIRFLPADEPPIIIDHSPLNICLGDDVIINAESFFDQPNGQFGEGGEFNYAQPDGWRVDGEDGEFPASGNNTNQPTWKETNSNDNRAFSGINYNTTDGTKFAMANGIGNYTTLETPVFSTIGMTSSEAIMRFDTSYYFCNGGYGEIWLSFDSGNTYPTQLNTIEGHDFDSVNGGTTTTGIILANGQGNKCIGQTNPRMVSASLDLGPYTGLSGLRVMFKFYGSDSGCGTVSETTFPNPNNVNCGTGNDQLGSGWAIDGVGFVYAQVDDELEWTDENGDVIAIGTTATVTPVTPGIREYGVTTLVNGCRSDNTDGTNFIDIGASLAYAGRDYTPLNSECGENALQLNAYDNTQTAIYNFDKGAWENNLYVVPNVSAGDVDIPGTGVTGQWSITNINSPGTCGSSATFSDSNSPDAIFTADPGTYTLRWALTNGCFDEITVTIKDCATIDFDGVNDYVTFRNNYNFNSDFSIEMWVKPNSVSGTKTLFSRKDDANNSNGYNLTLVNGQVRFNWFNGIDSGSISSGVNTINTNRWYHLAVTYNGVYRLYVDGIMLDALTAGAPAASDANIEALLGAIDQGPSNEPKDYFHGWIDELRIWNKSLNVTHIRQMMNQEIEASGSNVVGAVIPLTIHGPDNNNDGIDDDALQWNNLVGYYRMNTACGDFAPYKGVSGRLRNITTSQQQTAPLPYTTRVANQTWNTSNTWTNFNVWDTPNSNGIDGTPIDWNIVRLSHHVISEAQDLTLLGLLVNPTVELTVTNNTGTQDETNPGHGLWVTHYLDLDGVIDLIGESQLVQKRYTPAQLLESTLEVSSSGHIERDQQGTSNLYNYNYWSSPVSTINTSANNTPFSISGILRDGSNTSTPQNISWVTGHNATGASNPITVSRRWIYAFYGVSNTYSEWDYLAQTGTLSPGLGYTMKGSGVGDPVTDVQNYVFVGKPNNGSIIYNNLPNGNSLLVGNPYPSAVDADAFIKDNIPASNPDGSPSDANPGTSGSIEGALYFWVHYASNNTHILADYQGGYAVRNLTEGIPPVTPPITVDGYEISGLGSSSLTPTQYIPVGQGFFIGADTTPGGEVRFHNSQRIFKTEIDPNVSIFARTTNNTTQASSESMPASSKQLIRLTAKIGTNEQNTSKRHLLLGFIPNSNASAGFDYGYDAENIDDFPSDVSFVIDNKSYVIQGVNAFNDENMYPLKVVLANNNTVEIDLESLENFDDDIDVFIYDAVEDSYHQINNMPYTFNLTAGTYNNRYFVTFTADNSLSVADLDTQQIVVNYLNSSSEILIKTPTNVNVKQVTLISILGQTVMTWNNDNQTFGNEIKIPVTRVSQGGYIVKVDTKSGGSISKKIIVN
ncbi:MAG: DUF5011 domain-containing protein, partial [Algicola sp.]|nr:DUF5011 domain-containing protein [Algicola sp.]